MESGRQFRLLLWKDYLTRKRNLVTLCGVVWAVVFMLCLYSVRVNVDNEYFPTCQFSARALPSAGLLTFLQSFICNINNECSPMDQYEEIPTYENSKLTQIQREFSPLLYNESVLSIAASVPDALKMLAKLADVVDEPTFVSVTNNGLRVRDLFQRPDRASDHLQSQLGLSDDVLASLMDSSLSPQGAFNGDMNLCNPDVLSRTIMMQNEEHLKQLSDTLCSLSDAQKSKVLMDMVFYMDFSKYIKMFGNMYSKLSPGDDRLTTLGDTAQAVARMVNLRSFVPLEAQSLVLGDRDDFSYVRMDFFTRILDQLKPTFGDTEFYKTLKDNVDIIVTGVEYLDKFMTGFVNNNKTGALKDLTGLVVDKIGAKFAKKGSLDGVSAEINKLFGAFENMMENSSVSEAYDVLAILTQFAVKLLPDNKHEILFYSTLLAKMLEGAGEVVKINVHIEEIAYNASLRNPDGVKVLLSLKPDIIAKGFDALNDAERTQIMTSNYDKPDAMFCNTTNLEHFFRIQSEEAALLQSKLCTDAWKSYAADLIRSFGIYEVEDKIRGITGLLLLDMFGKDTSKQVYTIQKDFQVLKGFIDVVKEEVGPEPEMDWSKVFNVSEDSEVIKVMREKGKMSTMMLITVHGALAKEVVTKNSVLNLKMSPALRDIGYLVRALDRQLDGAAAQSVAAMKGVYKDAALTALTTALDEEKTYRALSTRLEDIACGGADGSLAHLALPAGVDRAALAPALCNFTAALEGALDERSALGRAIKTIMSSKHTAFGARVNWTELIDGVRSVYSKLERDYPYVVRATYGMDAETRARAAAMAAEVNTYWFGRGHLDRAAHLCVKLLLRAGDVLEHPVFGLRAHAWWARARRGAASAVSALTALDDFMTLAAASIDDSPQPQPQPAQLPAASAAAAARVVRGLPRLVRDSADLVLAGDTDVAPIISMLNAEAPWPCGNASLSGLLPLSAASSGAVAGLEALMCPDDAVLAEWRAYFDSINADRDSNTTNPPSRSHVFLELSSVFDATIRDSSVLQARLAAFLGGSLEYDNLSFPAALDYAVRRLSGDNATYVLRNFLGKVDTVLNAVESPALGESPLSSCWERFASCAPAPAATGAGCRAAGRAAYAGSLKFASTTLLDVTTVALNYFDEVYDPDSNLLQILGFTKGTGLYMVYEKLPDILITLLNSYTDYRFMTEVRAASRTEFWDCAQLVGALRPPPGARLAPALLARAERYLCPQLLYWVGLPRGENALLDLLAEPQYNFYVRQASNLTSNYEAAFTKANELYKFFTNRAQTKLQIDTDTRPDTLADKLNKAIDNLINYQINDTNVSYRLFNDINKRLYASYIYVARIVAMVNKLSTKIDKITIEDVADGRMGDDLIKPTKDLETTKRTFKRKVPETIYLHFDVITQMLWRNEPQYRLTTGLDMMCGDINDHNSTKDILAKDVRLKSMICTTDYKVIYGAIQDELAGDYEKAKDSLLKVVQVLREPDDGDISDISDFLNERSSLLEYLRSSIEYDSVELGLPVYLQYLHSNIRQYEVVLTFLGGGDWWQALRQEYSGPYATQFLDTVEKSILIADDLMDNLDQIHLVRLARDATSGGAGAGAGAGAWSACGAAEYVRDGAGEAARALRLACGADPLRLAREVPPLLFAAQGFEPSLELPKEVNYTALDLDILRSEAKLDTIVRGPRSPRRPAWVNEGSLAQLRKMTLRLLEKETLTKISFGVMANMVDAATLFLNNSQCTHCSQATAWIKQLSLQLIKKADYDGLMCRLRDMTPAEVHRTLTNDFHWDLSIRELLSTRNYTTMELNKSLNQLLEQVKLHLLEDLSAPTTKLAECLMGNVTKNGLGNATLLITVMSNTLKLLRSATPHLHEVEGFKRVGLLQRLRGDVAHKLDVYAPVRSYVGDVSGLVEELNEIGVEDGLIEAIVDGDVNLRLADTDPAPLAQHVRLRGRSWRGACEPQLCARALRLLRARLDPTLLGQHLPELQDEEFWRLTFVSDMLATGEQLLGHAARVLGVASKVDLEGVAAGRLEALLDFMMEAMMDDTINGLVYSIGGVLEALQPVVEGSALQQDLRALAAGLAVLLDFKNYVLEQDDLKVEVRLLFPRPERVERGLAALGVNNTNFWSLAAPRIHAGRLLLKPLFSPQSGAHRIGGFVCSAEQLALVLAPEDLAVVTAEDVLGAVVDQFCGMGDERARRVAGVLLANVDYGFLIQKVSKVLLNKLFLAANLSRERGELVLRRYPEMVSLVPLVQRKMTTLGESLVKEPVLEQLGSFESLGGLLTSSGFLANASRLACGRALGGGGAGRLYRAVAATADRSRADPAQAARLPTDFCRSLYSDIMKMSGGRIVWSFVKPLIMGKILYTPPSRAVDKIIRQANSTFALVGELAGLVHSFAGALPALGELARHREGVRALRRAAASPALAAALGPLGGAAGPLPGPELDLDKLFDGIGDDDATGGLLRKASALLRCVSLDRFEAAPGEAQLARRAAELTQLNEFAAGLVFLNVEELNDAPINVEYKIRMDIENVPTTTRKRAQYWTPGPESSFLEDMRYFRGFVQIQDMVDKAIVDLAANSSRRVHKRDVTGAGEPAKWASYTQQVPYPCYTKDFFQATMYESQGLIVTFFFSLMFTVASAVRFVVADKESGNTMLMSVMGVNLNWHTLSWFVTSLAEGVLTVCCMVAVLCWGGVLPRSDPSLLLALLVTFVLAVLAFCYMISKLFRSASFAAVCAALAYMLTFMPFVIIVALEARLALTSKIFTCLSMSSAFSYAFLLVARLEARGLGAGWARLWRAEEPDGAMTMGLAALMMLLDAALYFAVGWLIDRFFGLKTLRSNITVCTNSDEKAGVSIVSVSKYYGTKRALHNVSVELTQGQVTALLGHNGAGKTTLVRILMGMTRPSSGHVVVRAGARRAPRLGACPQRDVLLECLTAEEHIALYAQLKSGLPLAALRDEVDSMVGVLSLRGQERVPVRQLSGGTRRRVCVALAFVARPALVSLDEPTAGVDPAARREIWSMILKLKEGRTVLLTTHHLDEAELLSDQLVIMHKGEVHTTGSPIEIKRTLGSGYRLTVSYPLTGEGCKGSEDCKRSEGCTGSEECKGSEEVSIEERSKQLLAAVRAVVKNAQLLDVTDQDVDINLPFFDANGLNNDFLRLCTALEGQQEQLDFGSYSMDCSSLEQVFAHICQQADARPPDECAPAAGFCDDSASKSASSLSSVRGEAAPLVAGAGPLRGARRRQLLALLWARYLHYSRNRWLLFLLVALPTLFVTVAMAFSLIRPPADNELPLRLAPDLYAPATQFVVPEPSRDPGEDLDPAFARRVMRELMEGNDVRNWTSEDNPSCSCSEGRQQCSEGPAGARPGWLALPDARALGAWLVGSQERYIESRYTGYSAAARDGSQQLVAWYNNKGPHALPAALAALHSAALRAAAPAAAAGGARPAIRTHTHPLKISHERLSKATVLQHVADAGITAMLLVAASLVSAGGALYLVAARRRQEKRLQLLCGVSPALYWGAALVWDLAIMLVNVLITVCVLEAFAFPVFVHRSNLLAICILMMLFGYACAGVVHVAERAFSEPSMANMVLFCGNVFVGLVGVAVLLVLDVVSASDETDSARRVVHGVFMLFPQFVFADGLLEIAKNTIKAQVLGRFGMDTYEEPVSGALLAWHYASLALVGSALLLLNLAVESGLLEPLLDRFRRRTLCAPPASAACELDAEGAREVRAEGERVLAEAARAALGPPRVSTLGYINKGYEHTNGKSISFVSAEASRGGDVAQCVGLGKVYAGGGARRPAVCGLTLGLAPGQCTALLGQNGAGKSSTFAMLTGQERPSGGALLLGGRPATRRDLCTGLISYCPQTDAIDPLLTVRETLQLYCRLRGIDEEDQVVSRALRTLGLREHAAARGGALSGGTRRKLCAALALAARSRLVLLDEPTSGMDVEARACLRRGVRGARAAGRAVLVSTHALPDARALADRVALLRAGRLAALAHVHRCLTRFGGGFVVSVRMGRRAGAGEGAGGGARGVWAAVRARAAHAQLRAAHCATLQFLVPTRATVNGKEVTTRLSDIFRLMAELQSSCDIEDYTINQSSLDQMFSTASESSEQAIDLGSVPNSEELQKNDDVELEAITAL